MNTFDLGVLNKKHTAIIKGVGILMIVLHNFFHWVEPSTGENEFIFSVKCTQNLFEYLGSFPLESINLLFSFFGHFGVQLFIFISGYGLTFSYMRFKGSGGQYFRTRLLKIYPTFLIGILTLLAYLYIIEGVFPNHHWWKQISYKLLMINNLLPEEALTINGPWWFYSFIFQIYLLFPIIFSIIRRWSVKGFVAICFFSYLAIFFLYDPLLNLNVYIMANAPGHLPEFSLGVLMGWRPGIKCKIWWFWGAIAFFIIGNIHFLGFPFTFLAATVIMLFVLQWFFLRRKNDYSSKHFLIFYGNISMYLFAVHGFFRPLIIGSIGNNGWYFKIALAIVYLFLVTVVAMLARSFYKMFLSGVSYLQKKNYQ